MKKYIVILIAALFFGCSDKKNQEIYLMEIGKPAPKLALKRFVYPKKTKFEGLDKFKGRAIILSFFASWQENSVSGLEKINFFHDKFKSESAVFISVTDESKAALGMFLRKRDIKGYLGVKASADTLKNFRVYQRPMSVLISSDSIVKGFMDTNELTGDAIKSLINGSMDEL